MSAKIWKVDIGPRVLVVVADTLPNAVHAAEMAYKAESGYDEFVYKAELISEDELVIFKPGPAS